jgi:hypothetical protein
MNTNVGVFRIPVGYYYHNHWQNSHFWAIEHSARFEDQPVFSSLDFAGIIFSEKGRHP